MTKHILKQSILPISTREDVLENILKDAKNRTGYQLIISLNLELLMAQMKDKLYDQAVAKAQYRIIDGAGVVLAARMLGYTVGSRYPGVDLMSDLIKGASENSLSVLVLGGRPKVADDLAVCQKQIYPSLKITALQGIKDISNPTEAEMNHIKAIVADVRPHLIFASFGSPSTEKWFEANKGMFDGCICMSVGGAIDFLSGRVRRAPVFVRSIGLEWLYRLIIEPWRIKRQLNLFVAMYYVVVQKLSRNS